MTRRVACALFLASMCAWPAHSADSRLITHAFVPGEVVRMDARLGVQAVITFQDDEHIENVAIGDSANWQITPNKRANLLFVKPLTARGRTNLTVVTDKLTYFFDLVSGSARTPAYQLRFTYSEPFSPSPKSAPQLLTPDETGLIQGRAGALPLAPEDLNFAWRQSGAANLLPSKIYDDGKTTYLSWPANSNIPALFITDEKGNEGPVNFAARSDGILVDGIPDKIILRLGRSKALLERMADGAARSSTNGEKK